MHQTAYKNYLLIILLLLLAFNFVDRLVLGLVLQDIKGDLRLSDTQLGFLSGIAFALFYSVMGIPIAKRADRGDRVLIISLTAALWSVMVALCGMAGSFLQLLLVRIGVAVGEAGCIPPANSLIADYFTRAERPRAVSRYLLGGPLAYTIGYSVAGWLNQLYGWRLTFVILSLPGLILAPLARFTLKEPRRKELEMAVGVVTPPLQIAPSPLAEASIKEVFATLWRNATFRYLLLTFSVSYFFGYGILQWQPAFFIRSYGLKTGEMGAWFTLIYGVGGMAGTYLGGALASRYAANNESLQLRAMAIAFSGFGLLSLFVYLSRNYYLAFGLLAVANIGGSSVYGPLFSTIQTLVPERMRAMSIALIYLFANLVGMGMGPLVAGALSDAFRPWAGEESLRYALLTFSPGYLWAAWYSWRASQTVASDVAAVQANHAGGDLSKVHAMSTG